MNNTTITESRILMLQNQLRGPLTPEVEVTIRKEIKELREEYSKETYQLTYH